MKTDDLGVSSIKLDKKRVAAHMKISEPFLEACKMDVNLWELDVYGQLGLMLWREVACESAKTKHSIHYEFPSSPWQHFKEKYFSGWLLRKFPVKYGWRDKEVEFEETFLYPSLRVPEDTDLVFKRNFLYE